MFPDPRWLMFHPRTFAAISTLKAISAESTGKFSRTVTGPGLFVVVLMVPSLRPHPRRPMSSHHLRAASAA